MDYQPVIFPGTFLLPAPNVDLNTWACIACDQYTADDAYWAQVDAQTNQKPSTAHLILPEIALQEADARVEAIHQTMQSYLDQGVIQTGVTQGYVLTERNTKAGARLGLVCLMDLEAYSFEEACAVRPSEETIKERIPARMAIRQNAPIELSHVMILMNDPMESVLEALFAKREALRKCYDFPLMMEGGHLTGYAVEEDAHIEALHKALTQLPVMADGMRYVVGDGNHSLATAKACWEAKKATLSPEQQKNHPARYAMVELVNILDDAMQFCPIHRVLYGYDGDAMLQDMAQYVHQQGIALDQGGAQEMRCVYEGKEVAFKLSKTAEELATSALQGFVQWLMQKHPDVKLDYVHGEEEVRTLAMQKDTVGFLMPTLDKTSFFSLVSTIGTLPCKTFSLGESNDKRFYMESRLIK